MTNYTGTLVSVTQDDIDRGNHSAHKCPVALATQRALNLDRAAVCLVYMLIAAPGQRPTSYTTPAAVASFIADFDSQCFVSPFEFKIGERRF